MLVYRPWLQEYIKEELPPSEKVAEILTLHALEVEAVEGEVIDIDVLPNRAHDALGHWGVARELATLFEYKYTQPDLSVKTDDNLKSGDFISLTVEDNKLVPRATKRYVADLKVGPSPDWIKERLEALGQRSINNIVDLTNYVMLETGQPVHAFDFDKLSPDRSGGGDVKNISIRGAKAGESVTTLDGEKFDLEEGMLVIADDEKPLDIAGAKGGNNSGIDEKTTRIVLSVCNFQPENIRNTSRKLGLITDATKRFGGGLAPELVAVAIDRLSQLIAEHAGGSVASDYLDEYPRQRNQYLAGVSTDEVNNLLGLKLKDKDVEKILDRLGFEWKKVKPLDIVLGLAKEYVGVPYKYGASISFDAPEAFDCSSFTSYLYANGGLGIPRMTVDQFVFGEEVSNSDLQVGDLIFSHNGSEESKTHHESKEFLPGIKIEGGIDHVGLYIGDGYVVHAAGDTRGSKVINEPLLDSPSFKKVVGYRRMLFSEVDRYVVSVPFERLDIGIKQDLIEEIGRVYGYENVKSEMLTKNVEPEILPIYHYASKVRDILVEQGFSEVQTYSLVDKGDVELDNPFASDKGFMRSSLRPGLAEALSRAETHKPLLGTDVVKVFEIGRVFGKKEEHMSLALGASGMKQGKIEKMLKEVVGSLEETLGTKLKGKFDEGIFEVYFGDAVSELPTPSAYELGEKSDSSSYKPISQYPFILRDIAVWVTDGNADNVRVIVEKHAGDLLARTDLFDEFEKDGRTSYAFHLVFQSHDKTLSDDEVTKIMDAITSDLEGNGWEVR